MKSLKRNSFSNYILNSNLPEIPDQNFYLIRITYFAKKIVIILKQTILTSCHCNQILLSNMINNGQILIIVNILIQTHDLTVIQQALMYIYIYIYWFGYKKTCRMMTNTLVEQVLNLHFYHSTSIGSSIRSTFVNFAQPANHPLSKSNTRQYRGQIQQTGLNNIKFCPKFIRWNQWFNGWGLELSKGGSKFDEATNMVDN